MTYTIKIKNLKNIKNLEFEIPRQGVWLLTGLNGSGKSSLLVCMQRPRDPYAFQRNFKASLSSQGKVDNFKGATISYEKEGRALTYTYHNERWASSPRTNLDIIENLPYSEIIYLAADPERISPRQEDFTSNRVRAANTQLIELANEILGTNKFSNLKKINVTRGSSEALLIEESIGSKKIYYSEKNFSLGEICVLKLLKTILKVAPGALILIDEIELALHPKAQINLYNVLQRLASNHNHTIIITTHSVSLIKAFPRNRTLFLENDANKTTVKENCFSSYILGHVALAEEYTKDVIYCVEDSHSSYLLEAIFGQFSSEILENRRPPSYSILKIGGSSQVIKMIENCNRALHSSTKRFGVFDQDVEETIADANCDTKSRQYVRNNRNLFKYLPVTPEVGIIKWLINSPSRQAICHRLNIQPSDLVVDEVGINDVLQKNGRELRNGAKRIVNMLLTNLQTATGHDEAIVCRELYHVYVQNCDTSLKERFREMAGSLFFG